MLNICSLIQKFFGFIKTVSKKMYRTGLIVMSGAVLFAIVAMNSNSFSGAGKNNTKDLDGNTIQESLTEEDETDESAEIQLDSIKLQNEIDGLTKHHKIDNKLHFTTLILQKDSYIAKDSEPMASLVGMTNKEYVGSSGIDFVHNADTISKQTTTVKTLQNIFDIQTEIVTTANQAEEKKSQEIVNETESVTEPETTQEVITEAITQAIPETQAATESQPQTEPPTEKSFSQNYNIVNFNISDEDYYWLIRIVETEAGDQDEIGRILVANVIFNRVRSGSFPGSVKSVIFQNNGRVYQFEPVKNKRIYNVTPSQTTIDCVGRAMAGEDYSSGALFFTMRTSSNSWFNRDLNLLFVHGDHYFYTY